jgi:acyl transferase domain-containing protein/SAM-dependent methyltransferase
MEDTTRDQAELPPVKQAILKLRTLSAKLDALEYRQREPIAIVGVGLRFPGGADSPENLWRLLLSGANCVGEVPRERWNIDALYDPDPDAPGKMYTRYGAFLENIDGFDPLFFSISPREASKMDPQQRLLMEVGWETLENAGLAPDRLSGSPTGVFLGMGNSDYFRLALSSAEKIDAFSAVGSAASIAASRLSYLLNFKGPSLAVDTACSSSLVAIHLAVRSLRSAECSLALAGGVNLMLTPELSINLCKARMLTAGDKCKTFDAGADGYVRGEGCAMVALKRLSDAKAHGDRILAVIRGSAINQDGHTSGITAPNGPSQEAVITAALKDGGVQPAAVGYIEAHGTATSLGDPIEMNVLGSIFGKARGRERPLAIGSIKTNMGHLEAAAGIAGLIKAALVVHKGTIPAHLHLEKINPHIPMEQWPFFIPAKAVAFPAAPGPCIAGVSSFGFSGTNAHIVLESVEADGPPAQSADGVVQLLTLSTKSEKALRESAARFQAHLATAEHDAFQDICSTANTGRGHFAHRLALMADSKEKAASKLAAFCKAGSAEALTRGSLEEGEPPAKVAFLFTGQGAQYPGMGRALYETQSVFREALEHCEEALRPHLDQPLLKVLFAEAGAASILNQSHYTQTALFALEYALVRLWRSWGVRPAVVMGHSLGEYAAACAAGVFGVAEGLELIVERARLIESLSERGAMAAIFAGPEQVAAAIAPYRREVSIAALNGPGNTVISGSGAAIEKIVADLSASHIVCRPLNVAQAFHSPLLDPILDPFERAIARIRLKAPEISLISNVSGRLVEGSEITTPLYWRRHMREPVRFADSVGVLARMGIRVFIEIGPQPVLSAMARSIANDDGYAWLPSLSRQSDDRQQMLETLAALYVRGGAVDWTGFHKDRTYRKCALPTYPFQRERYWTAPETSASPGGASEHRVSWEAIVAAGQRQAAQGPLELKAETYAERWTCLEGLTIALTSQTLFQIGAFDQANALRSVDDVLARCAIPTTYKHLIHRWIVRLTDAGILIDEGGRVKLAQPRDLPQVAPRLARVREVFSDQPRFIEYIERCAGMLADVITGRQPALDTLFPEGSPELAEWLYGDFSLSKYISGIAASAVAAMAGARQPAAPLRILEIGAGTGGTTNAVLRSLPQRRFDYWFTDVSEFFFPRAEERFARFSSFRCGLLDIEKSPRGQGFAPHSFQAVVATNVLHATRNLDKTIDHVLELMAPGAVLVLSEVTRELAWYDITTGLIEGWQIFEDGLRADSPILHADRWAEILKRKGFAEVEVFPPKGLVTEVLGQHVLIARGPLTAPAPDIVQVEVHGASPANAAEHSPAPGDREPFVGGLQDVARKVIDSSEDERRANMLDFVQQQVAHVLRMGPGQRPGRRSRLMDIGVDSLLAIELRNRLGNALNFPKRLPASLIFDYPTPEAIAVFLEETLVSSGVWRRQDDPTTDVAAPASRNSAEEIVDLSDEQVEQMLLERLNKKQNEDDR